MDTHPLQVKLMSIIVRGVAHTAPACAESVQPHWTLTGNYRETACVRTLRLGIVGSLPISSVSSALPENNDCSKLNRAIKSSACSGGKISPSASAPPILYTEPQRVIYLVTERCVCCMLVSF